MSSTIPSSTPASGPLTLDFPIILFFFLNRPLSSFPSVIELGVRLLLWPIPSHWQEGNYTILSLWFILSFPLVPNTGIAPYMFSSPPTILVCEKWTETTTDHSPQFMFLYISSDSVTSIRRRNVHYSTCAHEGLQRCSHLTTKPLGPTQRFSSILLFCASDLMHLQLANPTFVFIFWIFIPAGLIFMPLCLIKLRPSKNPAGNVHRYYNSSAFHYFTPRSPPFTSYRGH